MQIDVHLGVNAQLTLSYEFYDYPVAKTIYQRMHFQENRMIDRTIFKNFGESVTSLEVELQSITDKLNELIGLAHTDILDKHKLHEEFPKYNEIYVNDPVILPLLQRFNTLIHHIEELERSSGKTYQFACYDLGVDMEYSWYDLFTPFKRKGEMYMHYPHIGKHFMELVLDKDYDVPEEQIVLTNKCANTFSFWCDEDRVPKNVLEEKYFEQYCLDCYEKIKHKLPYKWGDPRLAIGYIPIGKYMGDITDQIDNIAKHKYIHSWTLK